MDAASLPMEKTLPMDRMVVGELCVSTQHAGLIGQLAGKVKGNP
jgi:hypothetical protein